MSHPAPIRLTDPLRRAFGCAVVAFVVAGLAGTLMRFGMRYGLPFDLELANVRFAHTHLMYFGWATPALFALVGALLVERTGRPPLRLERFATAGALLAAAVSFVPFALDGYGPTAAAGLRLPLSMVASTLALLAWVTWAGAYVARSWDLPRDLPLVALDAAVLALLVASAGGAGLAMAAFAPVAPGVLMDRLVPFYLGVFSSGWFTLALVGVLGAALAPRLDHGLGKAAVALVLGGVLVASLLDLLAGPMWPAQVGRLAAAYGTVVLGMQLALASGRARWPAPLLLAVGLLSKGLLEGALVLEPVAHWSERSALPVWWAHAFLLGLLTLGLVWTALRCWVPDAVAAFWGAATAVAVLLLGMAPLTLVWPFARGSWVLPVAAWTSLAPTAALVVVGLLVAWAPRE